MIYCSVFRHPPDPLPAPHSPGGYVPGDITRSVPLQPSSVPPPLPSTRTGERAATEQEQEEVGLMGDSSVGLLYYYHTRSVLGDSLFYWWVMLLLGSILGVRLCFDVFPPYLYVIDLIGIFGA